MATAAAVAVALVFIGLTKGAHVAGAADSYGYVRQAHLWATGNLRPAAPGYELLPAGVSSDAFVPLGYRFASDRVALVPVYAPGLPMQMALFEWLGGPSAVFYVMPLLAGMAVWGSYVFYMPFEAWWTLRFLLPAFPALCVLASAGLFGAAARVPVALRTQVVTLVLAVALGFSLEVTRTYHALDSVVLASLHSGARFYAERLTMRWDFIEPRQLDSAVEKRRRFAPALPASAAMRRSIGSRS